MGQNKNIGTGTCNQKAVGTTDHFRHAFMRDHVLLEKIGSAWRLFFHLLWVSKGNLIGTYDEIGKEIGIDQGRTVRNWCNQLKEQGIILCIPKGKRVEIKLCEPHLSIALAPDRQPAEQPETSPYLKDPKVMGMLKIYEGASQMDSHIEFTVKPNASD